MKIGTRFYIFVAILLFFVLPPDSAYASWPELDKLVASDGTADDCLGYCISNIGDYAVAGALLNDDNGIDSGSAYMFGKGLCPSADLTGDCFVDFKYFAEVAGQWLQGAE